MNTNQLLEATLNCLAETKPGLANARVIETTPISGGYSRQTYKIKLDSNGLDKDLILQYLPKGATGLVRVDRNVERDLLEHLSRQDDIPCSNLIAADLDNQYLIVLHTYLKPRWARLSPKPVA